MAKAQKHTENLVAVLSRGQKETRRQLGGLSDTVGYTRENVAYIALPPLLERDHGLKVQDRLKPGYIKDVFGQFLEVNIVGRAQKNGQAYLIIGEVNSKLSKNDIDRFLKRKLQRFEGLPDRSSSSWSPT